MPNPAFIVDGHTEQVFISKICPGRPIQRTNLNGKDVSIEAIANKVASMIRIFGNRHYPIIILIDRENREQSVTELSNELLKELSKLGIVDQDIRIGFADVMIENWIIADYKLIGPIAAKPTNTDGLRGSTVIKRCLGAYNKVIDGVQLLLSIDRSVVYQNSESFKAFVDKLTDINCDFLNFER